MKFASRDSGPGEVADRVREDLGSHNSNILKAIGGNLRVQFNIPNLWTRVTNALAKIDPRNMKKTPRITAVRMYEGLMEFC